MSSLRLPSTRYLGSKRRQIDWISEKLKDVKAKSVLDVFGGTATVSLMFKHRGLRVHYNDLLKCNATIGTALIANSASKLSERDVETVLLDCGVSEHKIQLYFRGLYYTDAENAWIDVVVSNIHKNLRDPYKRALALSALFQACLAKRPFNSFHRANLNLRKSRVKRSFGNKTTWETPFETLFRRYVSEYNDAVFDNGQRNKVVGGYDARTCPNGVDLVYMDPPYVSERGTDYVEFYHFLERLADYPTWQPNLKDRNRWKRPDLFPEARDWSARKKIFAAFKALFEQFQDNKIALSYRDDGTPEAEELVLLLSVFKRRITVHRRAAKYVLSKSRADEILIVAE